MTAALCPDPLHAPPLLPMPVDGAAPEEVEEVRPANGGRNEADTSAV